MGGGFEYAVIGLSPYSFHVDLTKGGDSWRTMTYALALEDVHNYHMKWEDLAMLFHPRIEQAKNEISRNEEFNFNDPIGLKGQMNYAMGSNQRLIARDRTDLWKYKRYPDTVRENKLILQSFIDFYKDANVKTLLVVFPVTDIYRRFFSRQIMEEFYTIMSDIDLRDSTLLDYFASSEFDYNDFYDIDHLNRRGGYKVSKMINDVIMKI